MKITAWFVGVVSVATVAVGLGTAGQARAAAAHHAAAGGQATAANTLVGKPLHPAGNVPGPGAAVLRHVKPDTIVYATDWTGYVALANKSVALRYVTADFNVPSINCANSPAGSAGPASADQWVGLDDVSTVEQVGVSGSCNDGIPAYDAWYEMYPPDSPVTFPGSTISAGDAIAATVYYDSAKKMYDISLHDITSGQDYTASEPCPAGATCKNASAEAISEVPHFGAAKGWNLADYGMENFTNGAVTSNSGVRGTFAASKLWGSSEFVMVDSSHKILAYPSSLQGGSAFSTFWQAPL